MRRTLSAKGTISTHCEICGEPRQAFRSGAGLSVLSALHDGCSDGLTSRSTSGRAKQSTETIWIAASFEVLGGVAIRKAAAGGRFCAGPMATGVCMCDLSPTLPCMAIRLRFAAACANGLVIVPTKQRDFIGYLLGVRPRSRLTVVSRTGWHDIGGRLVFVFPGETIGPRGGERVILDAAASAPYETRGTCEEWRSGAAKLASGHALLVLAISAAFAGPLLNLAEARLAESIFSGHRRLARRRCCASPRVYGGEAIRPAMCARGAPRRTAWRQGRPARRIPRLSSMKSDKSRRAI